MTPLRKAVRRLTDSEVRDGSKRRALIITLYPNGLVGLRPAKTRREELVTVESIYGLAIKQRVAREQAEKKARKRLLH